METSGSLADRSLAVVFLEIAERKGTGVLRITQLASVAELTFVDGMLTKLLWDERAPGERVGQILLRARAITVGQLQESLAQQERTLRRIGDILIDFGFSTQEQLADALREQAIEGCVDILTWQSGDFRFYRSAESSTVEDFSPIDVKPLVTEMVTVALVEGSDVSGLRTASRRASRQGRIVEFVKTMGLFGMIGLGCALSLQLVLLDRFNLFRGPKPLIVESDALRHGVAQFNLSRIQRGLEIHRWLEGTYPASLDDLVRAGLVQPSDIHYPFHSPYVYRPAGDAYVLELPIR